MNVQLLCHYYFSNSYHEVALYTGEFTAWDKTVIIVTSTFIWINVTITASAAKFVDSDIPHQIIYFLATRACDFSYDNNIYYKQKFNS